VKHLSERPEPPSKRLGQPIAEDLEGLVLRCLAKTPSERPRARELESLFAECVDAAGWSQERVEPWWQAHARPSRSEEVVNGAGTVTVQPANTREAS
jgi:eukaryotic-like serine/threonine-protein kinase